MRPAWPRANRRLLTSVVLFAATLAIDGCGLGPPERFETAEVTGKLLEGRNPVGGGWVEFIPVDGTVGNTRSARIGTDGTFRADRVAVGTNALRLVNAPIQMPRGAELFGQFGTPVRRVVPASPPGPIRIELIDEAVRYQARRPRRPAYEVELEPPKESERTP